MQNVMLDAYFSRDTTRRFAQMWRTKIKLFLQKTIPKISTISCMNSVKPITQLSNQLLTRRLNAGEHSWLMQSQIRFLRHSYPPNSFSSDSNETFALYKLRLPVMQSVYFKHVFEVSCSNVPNMEQNILGQSLRMSFTHRFFRTSYISKSNFFRLQNK